MTNLIPAPVLLAIFGAAIALALRYLLGSPDGRGSGHQARHDLLPLSLMIRGVLSPGPGGVG